MVYHTILAIYMAPPQVLLEYCIFSNAFVSFWYPSSVGNTKYFGAVGMHFVVRSLGCVYMGCILCRRLHCSVRLLVFSWLLQCLLPCLSDSRDAVDGRKYVRSTRFYCRSTFILRQFFGNWHFCRLLVLDRQICKIRILEFLIVDQ